MAEHERRTAPACRNVLGAGQTTVDSRQSRQRPAPDPPRGRVHHERAPHRRAVRRRSWECSTEVQPPSGLFRQASGLGVAGARVRRRSRSRDKQPPRAAERGAGDPAPGCSPRRGRASASTPCCLAGARRWPSWLTHASARKAAAPANAVHPHAAVHERLALPRRRLASMTPPGIYYDGPAMPAGRGDQGASTACFETFSWQTPVDMVNALGAHWSRR